MKGNKPENQNQFTLLLKSRHSGVFSHVWTSLVIVCALISFLFPDVHAYANSEDSKSETDYPHVLSISLKIPYSSTDNESTTYEQSTARLSRWTQQHPKITLETSLIRIEDYDSEITSYASQNALPDLFLLGSTSAELWSSWNYLTDISDILTPEDLADLRMKPFIVDGKAYTFPALSSSPILIAYDIEAIHSAGLSAFPRTWEELIQTVPTFEEVGYSKILGVEEGYFLTYLAPRIFAENCNLSWQDRLLSGEEPLPYLDEGIPDVLEEIRMITESEVISWMSNPIESFLQDECPAAIITTDVLPALETAEKQGKQIGYALLPVSKSSTFGNEIYPTVTSLLSYALAINKEVSEDSDKFAACMDFCKMVSGCVPYEDDISPHYPDSIVELLNSARMIENPACYNVFTCINSSLQLWIEKDCEYTPREISNAMQNAYEKIS